MNIHLLSDISNFEKNEFYSKFLIIKDKFSEHDIVFINTSDLTSNENEERIINYLKHQKFSNVVFLCIFGNLTKNEYNPWYSIKPDLFFNIDKMFKLLSDKKIVLLTFLENTESYIQDKNLIKIINFGYSFSETPKTEFNKNFDSKKSFISLHSNIKTETNVFLTILNNLKLLEIGNIHILNDYNIKKYIDWRCNVKKFDLNKIIKSNIEYQNTFLEFIFEKNYTENNFYISNRTYNSIFKCNFPIWISSQGTVKFLRDIGLDVFDDIVDHSYDYIDHPYKRIETAISKNKELIKNPISIWNQNKHRFLKNISIVKDKTNKFYQDRFEQQINELSLYLSSK